MLVFKVKVFQFRLVRMRWIAIAFSFLGAFVGVVNVAKAETEASSLAPCASDQAPYRDFDFWLGEWNVYSVAGNQVGTNIITLRGEGCLVLEEWTGASGNTGAAITFFDQSAGVWRQLWQSEDHSQELVGERQSDGSMLLVGDVYHNKDGEEGKVRGRWTQNDDGSVLVEFELYDEDTNEWRHWFSGVHKRQEHE